MKLWILHRDVQNPKWGWYETMHGCIVRAATEDDARRIASESAQAEGPEIWLNFDCSTCYPLEQDGPGEMILADVVDG